jgi:hypothetical protein
MLDISPSYLNQIEHLSEGGLTESAFAAQLAKP